MFKQTLCPFYLFCWLALAPTFSSADQTEAEGALSCAKKANSSDNADQRFSDDLTVDLYDPIYIDGLLETNRGGVICSSLLRLQAQHLRLSLDKDKPSHLLAEGDVRLEVMNNLFIGQRLEYDLNQRIGLLYRGRSGVYPWFLGAEIIQLLPDGSYELHHGYLTTSERSPPEWRLDIEQLRYCSNGDVRAKDIRLYIGSLPLFKIPSLKSNVNSIKDNPLRFSMRWGGKQGARLGAAYEFFSSDLYKSFARLEYNFKRGPGGGVEMHYRNKLRNERFDTINYIARDIAPTNPNINTRYRFQGRYRRFWQEPGVPPYSQLEIAYDKLSDQQMATDYVDRGLELDIARRTQLYYRYQGDSSITNLAIRPRINSFQTINQQLPQLSLHTLPRYLFSSPILTDTTVEASYLDYKYANQVANVDDYTALRMYLRQRFYMPLSSSFGQINPLAQYTSIFYGNSPQKKPRWLQIGYFSLRGNLVASGSLPGLTHLLLPYFHYEISTLPTIEPDEHFIFTLEDGLFRTHTMRIGLEQQFLRQITFLNRPLCTANLYLSALCDCSDKQRPIPKLHLDLEYQPLVRLKNSFYSSFDLQHGGLAQLIFRSEWTISDAMALALEYRQRNAYEWRKAQRENYNLDFYRTQEQLLCSQLSDKHRTLLCHFYWRIRHDLALEWESRNGWDREHEPAYFEYNVNLQMSLPARWRMKLAYQHKEYEDRIAIYFDLGTPPPEPRLYRDR